MATGSDGGSAASDDRNLPWTAVPKFVPGVTDVTEYTRKMQFLSQIWPKEHLSALAPRAALLCEGTAFKKVSRLSASKLRVNDESGIQLLVTTLGGAWGQTILEEKYEQFERAVYGCVQRADETHDSYLARHDVHFEELLAQEISFEDLRSYILLRQSQLSYKKRIVIEHSGQLSYSKVKSSIRLLGSKFFQDMQNQRTSIRTKTYDANYVDEDLRDNEEEPGIDKAMTATTSTPSSWRQWQPSKTRTRSTSLPSSPNSRSSFKKLRNYTKPWYRTSKPGASSATSSGAGDSGLQASRGLERASRAPTKAKGAGIVNNSLPESQGPIVAYVEKEDTGDRSALAIRTTTLPARNPLLPLLPAWPRPRFWLWRMRVSSHASSKAFRRKPRHLQVSRSGPCLHM